MNQIKPFTGFPEAGLQFLADLATNLVAVCLEYCRHMAPIQEWLAAVQVQV